MDLTATRSFSADAPAAAAGRALFQIRLIKPSHYDDDGYVIRWTRSPMPANSLATVYGIIAEAADRAVLGPNVDIDLTAVDETNTHVDVGRLIADFRRGGGLGFVGLVGVQSNQYPRTLDIARPLRAAGVPVVIGGFHISGLLAMFPGEMSGLQEALDMGVSLFAGEAEGRIDELLVDVAEGRLKPIYNYIDELPALEGSVTPFLPRQKVKRTLGNMTSFDAGRGCPYQCSFCTIINVQGRKSRFRSSDDVEHLVRLNWAQGINKFFITDDNFARNKDWEAIFDRLIELRENHGIPLGLMIQVDTLCHKIPNFIEKAKRAGVTRVFIGLENVNPDNLAGAKKRQNKVSEYRKMLLAWKAQGIMTLAGYILGFPGDTPETIRRDIAIIKKELPLDIIEFFCLTPLPGSEDHQTLWKKNVPLHPDLNKYDLEHALTAHPAMSQGEWEQLYLDAWRIYYTPEHIETILRRARSSGVNIMRLAQIILWFSSSVALEKVHPLQGGLLRQRRRRERRPGLPAEPAWSFYPKIALGFVTRHARLAREAWRIWRICRRVEQDPDGMAYTDLALAPVPDDEEQVTLEIFTHNVSARESVKRANKLKAMLSGELAS